MAMTEYVLCIEYEVSRITLMNVADVGLSVSRSCHHNPHREQRDCRAQTEHCDARDFQMSNFTTLCHDLLS